MDEKDLSCLSGLMCTNRIYNSAILSNNYVLLLSDLCTCAYYRTKWNCKWSI